MEEYFDLIQDNELYDIEFYNHEITVKMSTATDSHELLVATIIRLLGNNFLDTDCRVYGSAVLGHAQAEFDNVGRLYHDP